MLLLTYLHCAFYDRLWLQCTDRQTTGGNLIDIMNINIIHDVYG